MHLFESENERIRAELAAEPGWLETSVGQVFCWFHPGRSSFKNRAVLLCDPPGSERMNLHLTYRHIAVQLAYAGYSVLRLDLPGSCDSTGGPRDPNLVEAWLSALDEGADYLKIKSGASELVLFGALLGGTLAAHVAARREDTSGLAAWGAYATGKEYLRFLKVQESLTGCNPEGMRAPDWQEGDLESMGFLFTKDTVAKLRDVTLEGNDFSRLKTVCLFGWDKGSVAEKVQREFRGSAVQIDLIEGDNLSGTLSLEKQVVPEDVIDGLLNWLEVSSEEPPQRAGSTTLPPKCLTNQVKVDDGVTENTAFFGANGGLFGIVTSPEQNPDSRTELQKHQPAIVLVNGGRNQRAGINRNYTEWARRWARQGYTVMRMDIAGLGDSPPLKAHEINTLYLESTTSDVRSAMDHLQDEYGIQTFVVGGLCAGGFQSLYAGHNDKRVVGLWLLELLRFYQLDKPAARKVGRGIRLLVHKLLPLTMVPRCLDSPLSNWLTGYLERGGRVLAVYREDELFYKVFLREVAVLLEKGFFTRTLKIETVPPSNHIFSPLWSQANLRGILDDWLSSNLETKSISAPK